MPPFAAFLMMLCYAMLLLIRFSLIFAFSPLMMLAAAARSHAVTLISLTFSSAA